MTRIEIVASQSGPLHLADVMRFDRTAGSYRYVTTRCGESITGGTLYTDDVPSLLDAEGAECAECAKLARKDERAEERAWVAEVATEAGMLHGIDAYNGTMGY